MLLAPGDPWEGYARTVVEIVRPEAVNLVVQPAPAGQVGAWPWPSAQPVYILTAWDPGTARPGAALNRRRQAALEAELAPVAVRTWVAVGVDAASGRGEEGVAVCGLAESDALALGARYGQDAIFAWTPVAWAVVACTGGRRVVAGWSLGRAQPAS